MENTEGDMTSKAEEYRAKAAQLDELAARNKGTDFGEQYLGLARQWRLMAEQVERRTRLDELLRPVTTKAED